MAFTRSSVRSRPAPPVVCPHRLVGLGHRPFTAATGVRIPLGTPFYKRIFIVFTMNLETNKQISVAPMMGQTDRHFRYLVDLLAPDIKLYTPMIHADAIVYASKKFLHQENRHQKAVGIQICLLYTSDAADE